MSLDCEATKDLDCCGQSIKMIVFDYDDSLPAQRHFRPGLADDWDATVDAFVAKYVDRVSYGICTAGMIFKDEIQDRQDGDPNYPRFPPGMIEKIDGICWWNLMFMTMSAEAGYGFKPDSQSEFIEAIPFLKVVALKETAKYKNLQHHEILFIDDNKRNIRAAREAGFMTLRIKTHEDFKKAEAMLDCQRQSSKFMI